MRLLLRHGQSNTFGNFVRTGFTQTNKSPVEREHYRVNEMPSVGTHDSSDRQEDPDGVIWMLSAIAPMGTKRHPDGVHVVLR